MLLSRFSGSGQWDRALETAREWLAVDPENSRAHMAAGQALLNLKRYAEADPHLRRALAGEPNNSAAHRFMSIAHFHANRFKEADEEVQTAISLSPEDHYNWYHLAWMFYRQGDKVSARKYVERARELDPRDADVVNLLALCAPSDKASAALRLRQYEEALALDPENAQVHNNIGAYHLNVTRNFQLAEEWFRRALFFDPSLKTARRNLFLTIKHRDKVYRVLCAPRDWLLQVFGFMGRTRKSNPALYILALIPVWIFAFRYFIAGLMLWCLLVWPMVKVYEFLTIGDLRHHAGEVGSRRGGFLGYRKWPVNVRMGIFGVCLVAFWTTVVVTGFYWYQSKDPDSTVGLIGAFLIVGFVVFFLIWQLRKMVRQSRVKSLSRKRAKRMAKMLKTMDSR
jgi:tetratricopeptide (TPR) repeat protein